jgi:uncharacterized protein RhaS with RHS repeats
MMHPITIGKSLGLVSAFLIGALTMQSGMCQTVQYSYDAAGRLSTVTNADSTTRTYLYENASFPNALTGLNDETNTRYSTWGYDSQGRATSTTEANGAGATSLVYNSGH